MRTQSTDTDSKTEAAWIALLQEATPARKFAQVRSLSELTLSLSRRAIARRNGHLREAELQVLLVHHLYGAELADRFREYLKDRSREEA
ncbi:MAG: hypothetical protein RBS72_03930 [Sedimentisphaerales bacterium]|mgnify:CR=1 FL=1|jgi:hypothetical protein|nr:hypothetical protein [Sedimentisphaerales bacterium]NLZ07282.1 hypothetical protein [Phycisphaerae bacterium]HNY78291.1 hypothetical protein [Sedimentisphaerales bacterium]HOC61838.1 hypothetical protein [Sedimentisphaerales bacterium]HOH64308.1 hypothetical protein [Sedimentisphaerales bacterium]